MDICSCNIYSTISSSNNKFNYISMYNIFFGINNSSEKSDKQFDNNLKNIIDDTEKKLKQLKALDKTEKKLKELQNKLENV